jgi:hypothetical protein
MGRCPIVISSLNPSDRLGPAGTRQIIGAPSRDRRQYIGRMGRSGWKGAQSPSRVQPLLKPARSRDLGIASASGAAGGQGGGRVAQDLTVLDHRYCDVARLGVGDVPKDL